ncbi:hypothetical protein [Candidatus Amarolinea aalborgensis]|jgi:hypothetical protein|uniref:hypothetical protein n=1 Tax=Candidatus Amarolinea aalborgensis TaxID=2249329 RepID=UPI003BF9C0FF
MKKLIPLTLLVFAGVLAYVVGQRMSTESMAVAIGVVVGVAASIPTSLLIASLMRRSLPTPQAPLESRPPPQAQPMIIVNPVAQPAQLHGGSAWQTPNQLDAVESPSLLPMPRRFRVIGADVNADD